MVRSVVSRINKSNRYKAETESVSEDSKITLALDFRKDFFDSDIDTKSEILDKHLSRLSKRVGFNLNLKQETENPDFQGTGHMLGTALGEIIEKRHGKDTFLRGKSIYSDGRCSSMFSMTTDQHAPVGSMDIRMLGQKEHSMEKELEDFLVGLCDGMRFHMNIVLEKVDDKKHEWDSIFESMSGSLKKVLNQ